MLTAGSPAPDVLLHLHDGTDKRLSAFRGSRVVLYFYPKDFTWGCTRQACSFAEHYQEIVSRKAVLIGISADERERHNAFAGKHHLPFPLASDPELTVARAFDVLRFGFRRLRVTYVLDEQGIIRGVAHHEIIVENHWRSVMRILEHMEQKEVS